MTIYVKSKLSYNASTLMTKYKQWRHSINARNKLWHKPAKATLMLLRLYKTPTRDEDDDDELSV